ncbi:MAG: hypothetical protein IJI01_01510 [Butyrivibrio sp.]|uniref:hypothetical protein n=1 Tax=Butyrivibrio sp. TaxID=28121 RepID=UPI0025BC2FB3|nr:hypothetical protein [Butyrivibrio sp.]MBQ6587338.1 hypothetical protein [Butyrivibrio sp.]
MKLRINCQKCDARKINEENYREFSQIRIYTEELIVDDRSKEILNRLPFNIKAEEVRSKDMSEDPGNKNLNINGVYEITPQTDVAEGTAITINGLLKIAPGAQDALRKFSRISINGLILCPKSIAALLPFPGLSINGMTKSYPDDYTLMDNRYKLDKYFPLRAPENTGYFAANFIYDGDKETDFAKLAEKNIKFSTEKVYIRKKNIETALPLFNIEAEIVEIPDNCTVVVSDQNEIDEKFVNANGTSLYIIGNADIAASNLGALEKIETLIVEGDICAEKACVQRLEEIGAKCDKLIIKQGTEIRDVAIANIDRATLEAAAGGMVVSDVALLKIDKDVPPELIRQRLKIRDCAKVSCSNDQKGAVSSVSSDVALIGTNTISSLFEGLFGSAAEDSNVSSEPSAFEDDTKYINAEYYEL